MSGGIDLVQEIYFSHHGDVLMESPKELQVHVRDVGRDVFGEDIARVRFGRYPLACVGELLNEVMQSIEVCRELYLVVGDGRKRALESISRSKVQPKDILILSETVDHCPEFFSEDGLMLSVFPEFIGIKGNREFPFIFQHHDEDSCTGYV